MCEKTVFYGHQFIWGSARKRITDGELFKSLPIDSVGMQRSSNDNCLYINKFKGCKNKTPCYCAIIIDTSEHIKHDLLSKFDLRLIDSITVKF